jgi:hypothetical protein
MTTSELARTLKARRYARGKWMARCPAHRERTGSLSIVDMGFGRTRLHCFGGCPQQSVLDALGLSWKDLDDNKRADPEAYKAIAMERRRQELIEKEARVTRGLWISQARFWDEEVRRIGKLLESDFDSDTLARQLHRAIEKGRTAQAHVRPYFHPCNVPGEN